MTTKGFLELGYLLKKLWSFYERGDKIIGKKGKKY